MYGRMWLALLGLNVMLSLGHRPAQCNNDYIHKFRVLIVDCQGLARTGKVKEVVEELVRVANTSPLEICDYRYSVRPSDQVIDDVLHYLVDIPAVVPRDGTDLSRHVLPQMLLYTGLVATDVLRVEDNVKAWLDD